MSSRRYRIVHHTTMHYAGEVTASHNELRMTPVSEPGQATLEARVRVRPLTWSTVYEDHWGTQVMAMEAQTPHDVLEIEATSMVERSEMPIHAEDVGWDAVRSESTQDRLSEFLAQTSRTAPPNEVVDIAERAAQEPTPRAAALALGDRITEALTYQPGITGWQSTAADVWTHRSGVCQDFAHVALGALRAIGIPARYVSGYVPAAAGRSSAGRACRPATTRGSSSGTGAGTRSTRRTPGRSASTTSSSAAAATTTTSRPSGGCSSAPRSRTWRSRSPTPASGDVGRRG